MDGFRKRPTPEWGCTHKRIYSTWADAEAACLSLMDDAPTRYPVMAYRCGWQDHGWHIGHSPGAARAPINHPARRIGYMAQAAK